MKRIFLLTLSLLLAFVMLCSPFYAQASASANEFEIKKFIPQSDSVIIEMSSVNHCLEFSYSQSKSFSKAKMKYIRAGSDCRFVLDNLDSSKDYYVRVRLNSSSRWSAVKKVRTLSRYAPNYTQLQSIKATDGKVLLKWNKVANAKGYYIYCSADKSFKKGVKTINVDSNNITSKSINSIKEGVNFYFKVRAYNKVKGKVFLSANSAKMQLKLLAGDRLYIANGNYVFNQDVKYKQVKKVEKGTHYSSYPDRCVIKSSYYYDINSYIKLLYKTYCKLNLSPDMNDFEKLFIINRWVNENVDYCWDYYYYYSGKEYDESHKFHLNSFDALKDRETVCDGYSELSNDLCYLAGIPCYYVAMDSINHAWDVVKLDGYWYQINTTGNYNPYYMFNSILKMCTDAYGGLTPECASDFNYYVCYNLLIREDKKATLDKSNASYGELWHSKQCKPHGNDKTLKASSDKIAEAVLKASEHIYG